MIDKFMWNLTPPEFEDKEKLHIATTLNFMLLAMIAVAGVFAVGVTLIDNNMQVLVRVFVVEVALLSILMVLMQKGYVMIARNIFVALLWLLPTLNTIISGSVDPAVYATYITIVLMAGLLISVPASVVFAMLSAATTAAISFALAQGMLQEMTTDNLTPTTWLGLSAHLAIVIATIHISKSNIQSALTRSNQDSTYLAETNKEFKANRLQLIEQAIKLTQTNTELKREIATRRKVEEEKNKSLAEKEVLLKEIHHRVKNNLQIVSSLLYLQSKKVKNVESQQVFLESQNRIRAMSLIHEKLYQSDDLADIDLDEYLHSLVKSLFISYGIDNNQVTYSIDAKNAIFDVELAIPCGVIISELVSNCLKHAFPEGMRGEILVAVKKMPPADWSIRVSDNGVGISQDLINISEPSLGLQLVQNLAAQLNGNVSINSNGSTDIEIKLSGEKPLEEEK